MEKEPPVVNVESDEESDDELMSKEENILEDANDMEFLFESIECLAAMKNQNGEPQREVEKWVNEAKVGEAWRLLEETSYLSDTEYNAPTSLHEATHQEEEDRRSTDINTGGVLVFFKNDLENPEPSSVADIESESPNTSISTEQQGFHSPRSSLLLIEHGQLHERKRELEHYTCSKSFSMKNPLKVNTPLHASTKHYPSKLDDLPYKRDNVIEPLEINSVIGKSSEISLITNLKMEKQLLQKSRQDSDVPEAFREGSEMRYPGESQKKRQKKENSYSCNICNKSLKVKSDLEVHLRTHTGEKPFGCDVCGKRFPRKGDFKRHQTIHLDAKPYKCTECGKRFTQQRYLKMHSYTHTEREFYPREVCGREFADKHKLKHHTHKHTYGKGFDCMKCGNNFTTHCSLKLHLRTHTEKKRFSCPVCHKTFHSQHYLSKHLHIHTSGKAFNCKVCDKEFAQKAALKSHSRIHSDERPFACSFCGRKFRHKCAMKVHTRLHTGEKPFKCNQCGKDFTQLSSLNQHSCNQGVERSFLCAFCGKEFKHKRTMAAHSRTYTPPKFCSNACKVSFAKA